MFDAMVSWILVLFVCWLVGGTLIGAASVLVLVIKKAWDSMK